MEFENVIQSVTNSTIYDSFVKAKQVIDTHDCISVSISEDGHCEATNKVQLMLNVTSYLLAERPTITKSFLTQKTKLR